MQHIDTGILSRGVPGTPRAALTFPSVIALAGGGLLATLRAGSTKDSADEAVELYRSDDGGRSWRMLRRFIYDGEIDGARGSFKLCYLTELASGHLLAAAMWVDRTSYPGQPLFNPATEGCLPMFILLAESHDEGATWAPWRLVRLPDEIGPASLTSPILKLPDGRLAMSVETNKHYHDASKWYQKVVLFFSDSGHSWGTPVVAGKDPSGRIFNWDQRLGLAPDGRIGAFVWTYDSQLNVYLNVHRRISVDGGANWTEAVDLGFADQAGRPAVLPDGRVLLPWVDRFGTQSIRARLAPAIDGVFDHAGEVVLYSLGQDMARGVGEDTTGALLAEMSLWTFGLPFAEALPDGDVLVVYYAGDERAMDIRWSRLRI